MVGQLGVSFRMAALPTDSGALAQAWNRSPAAAWLKHGACYSRERCFVVELAAGAWSAACGVALGLAWRSVPGA